jgi:hypothetical protein
VGRKRLVEGGERVVGRLGGKDGLVGVLVEEGVVLARGREQVGGVVPGCSRRPSVR